MSRIWTRFPPESYSVEVQGMRMGIGLLPIFKQVPGAWNLLALTWAPELEALLTFKGELEKFPGNCMLVAYCVGMALQWQGPNTTTKTWGELTEELTPSEFLTRLKAQEYQSALLPFVFGEAFWTKAEAMAAEYKEFTNNVIPVNFGESKIQ